jgi:hypothetical protein
LTFDSGQYAVLHHEQHQGAPAAGGIPVRIPLPRPRFSGGIMLIIFSLMGLYQEGEEAWKVLTNAEEPAI